ncbi:MAG: YdcF family protein [Anaerolineaceae bacterium]|nr:YdcF family protein [Anaerolineaceae bacterium]
MSGDKQGIFVIFFSRDKEPKLYNLLILILAAAAFLLFINRMADPQRLIYANSVMTVTFALAVVFLFSAFFRQLEHNPYSYNVIFYSGFGLFTLSLVWTHAYLTLQSVRQPDTFTIEKMLNILLDSAKNFLLLTTPLLIGISIASITATVILLVRTKDVFFRNLFGILLPAFVLFGLAGLGVYRMLLYYAGERYFYGNLLLNLFSSLFLYFECMFFGTVIAILITSNYHTRQIVDFLIILGCGLEKDGTPTTILQKRLDAAISFAEDQKKRSGKELYFVLSGGQGEDEIQSEAASMKYYLLGRGFSAKKMLLENQSKSTRENMNYSAKIILAHQPNPAAAFVSSNFHIFRGGFYAIQAGLKAVGISSPVKWYYWPNGVIGEFVGIIADNIKKQAVILFCFVFVYILLAVLVY